MIDVQRVQTEYAKARLFKGKAFLVFGPRQVGKTTFCLQLLDELNENVLSLNGDDADTRDLFARPNKVKIEQAVGDHKILFLDEAQRIPDIGLLIKIITDQLPHIQVIATGSSSFELARGVNEPLTGRKYQMLLLPFSHGELVKATDFLTEERSLEQRLIYGCYPEIVTKPSEAEELLDLLTDSYLFKDLFALEKVKKPLLLEKLLKALAFQVGHQVSYHELGQIIGADHKTVEKYITLLEQTFVVFSLHSYSTNLRNELSKSKKIYFYDNGIINAVINDFRPLHNRMDVGRLWENYIISERMKSLSIRNIKAESYFWRTTQQQEVDYIETRQGKMMAVEFKWNPNSSARISKTFTRAYPNAETMIVTPENRVEFLGM